jgi:hypothetical protein
MRRNQATINVTTNLPLRAQVRTKAQALESSPPHLLLKAALTPILLRNAEKRLTSDTVLEKRLGISIE